MRSNRYQIALILLGIVATIGLAAFFYRELYPEYRIYQQDYSALEEFRSSYTGEAPPVFKEGIKQIVIEREDKGPSVIDRCISCHVALQFPHFSPTKIARDLNGNILYDAYGVPVKEPNDQYIWAKLDEKVAALRDEKVNAQLTTQGDSSKVNKRLEEANYLNSLKTTDVDGIIYDVTKVLAMHPLMGTETRPFEFHPIETYGCTSCHNGNGRGLTTRKAHGPVFDGQYEPEFIGYIPQFLEKDEENDPRFSKVFNGKPGHDLLFQTTPIYVGALIESKCMECHLTTKSVLQNAAFSTAALINDHQKRYDTVQTALQEEKAAVIDAIALTQEIHSSGLDKTMERLEKDSQNYSLKASEREDAYSQLALFKKIRKGKAEELAVAEATQVLEQMVVKALGTPALAKKLQKDMEKSSDLSKTLNTFLIKEGNNKNATGSLFAKITAVKLAHAVAQHIEDVETSLSSAASDEKTISSIASEIDLLTYNYHRGMDLYISQACYACHRIAGFSRGGVGPELTEEGKAYPWYIKQKIMWPQFDLKTSTMPNMVIDHEELEDLMSFILSQMGQDKAVSSTAYKAAIQQWEAGKKMEWEKPVTPAEMMDLRYSMTVFATQGCAACHRLEGFDSNVGYAVEKEGKAGFDALYAEKEWFSRLFPEDIAGSDIVSVINANAGEIDKRIVPDVRQGSILEEIEQKHPHVIETFYTPFKFASRAKDTAFVKDPKKLAEWKERVHRVLMMFIQEYGLGRLIGPKPNWSGVYHTDEWLMEHFRNPAGHVPQSIMPVLPFDDTKFYALTHMLDVLGIRNRDAVHEIWDHRGFSPEKAFQIHCAQCHGSHKQGNGPVATWIYPIPKNLGDGTFLRNLTKEKAIYSIAHGVKGTPMPPWGEAADKPGIDGIPVLSKEEVEKLVDWLYSFFPGEMQRQEAVPKWQYSPEDAIEELKKEGSHLPSAKSKRDVQQSPELAALPMGSQYLASLKPTPVNGLPETGVEKYFNVIPNPIEGGEKDLYYIRKEFYTPQNIEAGKAFFELNCASCHGKEANGAGLRAEAMSDAKPRMLTNLDWIDTHDDLRLLRSIKYGVPGTAMTPWGDFTSSLQRMQLVIFIRSLNEQTELRSRLAEAIYKAFDTSEFRIERARWSYYPKLTALQQKLVQVQNSRKSLYQGAKKGEIQPKEAVDAYEEELLLLAQISKIKEIDHLYQEMKELLKAEKELYGNMGKSLVESEGQKDSFVLFLKALALFDGSFTEREGQFVLHNDSVSNKQLEDIGEQLEFNLQQTINKLVLAKNAAKGKISSPERSSELVDLNSKIESLTQLKNSITAGFKESLRLREQETEIFKQLQAEASTETSTK